MDSQLAKRRILDQWNTAYYRECCKFYEGNYRPLTDEEERIAQERAGPRPEYEAAERCEVVKAVLWAWDGAHEWPTIGYSDSETAGTSSRMSDVSEVE